VPSDYQHLHSKPFIQTPLKTDSRSIAEQRALALNQLLESYWQEIALKGETSDAKSFNDLIKRARISGFQYRSMRDIVAHSGEAEHPFRPNVNTCFPNASRV
jgi:hypothetical protein